jgi:hypothetical protein
MITATLRCGAVLSYEAVSFRPNPGELVPCRRHGYCRVTRADGSGSGALPPRGRGRVQSELMDWLRERSEATVHALLRRGFTLRVVAAAERDGLVDVDLLAGRVAVRPALENASVVTDAGHHSSDVAGGSSGFPDRPAINPEPGRTPC